MVALTLSASVICQSPVRSRLNQPALLGHRDDAAQLFESIDIGHHGIDIQIVDAASEGEADEAIDVAEAFVHRQRQAAAPLEPAAEHQVVLALVRAMLGDLRDEARIVRAMAPRCFQNAVQRCVAAMFVIDIDRRDNVQISFA